MSDETTKIEEIKTPPEDYKGGPHHWSIFPHNRELYLTSPPHRRLFDTWDGKVEEPTGAEVSEWEFVTTERLVRDSLAMTAKLPDDIDGVVAIARSGLLVGSLLATHYHVGLFTTTRHTGVLFPGHGGRLSPMDSLALKHVLLVDDTSAAGSEMRMNTPLVREFFPNAKVTRAVVYCHPIAAGEVDFYAYLYPGLHYLEWNWHNAGHGQLCDYDFDGIICHDCPVEDDDDGPRYRDFLANVSPLYLPRREPIPMIVTGRHAKYEGITRDWLNRHKIRVERLVMRQFDIRRDIPFHVQIAEFKATQYTRSDSSLFAESDPTQAKIISELTGKPVLCPAAKIVHPPDENFVREKARRMRVLRTCSHFTRDCPCEYGGCNLEPDKPNVPTSYEHCMVCPLGKELVNASRR